jgi:hypothetical protein
MNVKDAMRDEIQKALTTGEFTPVTCTLVMKLAEAAREFLRATTPKPEDFKDTTDHVGNVDSPYASPTSTGLFGSETFGARVLRDLIPAMKSMNQKPESTEDLVKALSTARSLGLADVAKSIEAKLGVGVALPSLGLGVPPPTEQVFVCTLGE